MKFKNPPIVEAICEFRFSKETKWDPTIPGLLFEKLNGEYPLKESRIGQELQVKADQKGIRHRVIPSQRAVFLTENRLSLIQLGENVLSVNCLKPYPGWEHFQPRIRKTYDTFRGITEVKGIDRVALVYVDKIEIPGSQIEMEEYFNFLPRLGAGLPQSYANFLVGCEIPYNKDRDICKLQLTTAMPEDKKTSAFLLTTEYFLAKKRSITPLDVPTWIEEAHQEIDTLFKGCITEKLGDIFGRIE
ncbi:MAG: TIGR04255 family protein [Methanoregula sp.]|uniref:TIGR04255 family protein n=1 Tax=Methanoregula sp. TaxID=2052170 RepID=UPI003C74A872